MFDSNKATVNGDHARIYQTIDNSRTTIYLSTGEPVKSQSSNDPLPVKFANYLRNLPESIFNFIDNLFKTNSDDILSVFGSLFLKAITLLALFAVIIVLSRPLSWITALCAIFSFFTYLYLQKRKSITVNHNFYIRQLFIFIAATLSNLPYTLEQNIYLQHTAINIKTIQQPETILNSLKGNISFWWNQLSTLAFSSKDLTPETGVPVLSCVLLGLITTIAIIVCLVDSLSLLSLKTNVSITSSFLYGLALIIFIGIVFLIPALSVKTSQILFSPK